MDRKLINGTYTYTKGKEGVQFWMKLGLAEKEAKDFVGTHWTMKIGYDHEKMWCKMDCKEFPTINHFMSNLKEGKEYTIPDKGFGKTSMMYASVMGKPNMVHTILNTERYGKYEVLETYSECGIKMEYICKNRGISYVENWCRVVKDTGSFRFRKGEHQYMEIITEMFPDLPVIDEGYKRRWSQIGDTFHEVATFSDGTSYTTTWKCDVEQPFMAQWEGKQTCPIVGCTFLMTKIQGGYKVICKNKTGRIQEHTVKFTETGAVQHLIDHTTGKVGRIEFDRFTDFSGEFKPITNVGGGEIASAMGWPVDVYQNIMGCPTTRVYIKHFGCHLVMDFKSKALPREAIQGEKAFKFGEEFSWKNPFDPTDNLKMVATANDNTVFVAGKGKMSIAAKYIFTESFMIREMEILGTGMTEKVIFARC